MAKNIIDEMLTKRYVKNLEEMKKISDGIIESQMKIIDLDDKLINSQNETIISLQIENKKLKRINEELFQKILKYEPNYQNELETK